MKKIILMSGLLLASIFSFNNASAFKLLGVKVHVEKGTKEWDATHTHVYCVGKGFCELTIETSAGLVKYTPGGNINGTLGTDVNGNLAISFPEEYLQDGVWGETFANGVVYIGSDIELTSEIRSQIKNCPRVIKAGNYRYFVEAGTAYVIFAN